MAQSGPPPSSTVPETMTFLNSARYYSDLHGGQSTRGSGFPGLKKRGHNLGSRSWILIDSKGNSKVVELDKFTLMRRCSLPSRDLRLLDPLFIYPSTILGREKAIVVSLEQIRCIITADEVILKNSLDGSALQYKSELCKRLETSKDQYDDLPFEFRALELALESTCMSLDTQVKELEKEIYPVLDELASSISTSNLERVRRFKGHLLALTQRVQKVCDEIEHLMDDDGDMAEIGVPKLQRALSNISSSKHGSFLSSSSGGENIDQLEMLLEAYFVVIDNTLNKLLSLKEYIEDTEDLINIKLGNVQNQLIQFELLLTAATFVATIFTVVTAVFGMNFDDSVFENASTFNWVLIITGVSCGLLYLAFLIYFRHKKVFPL
ncbi:UNVERIFIED_CONTAM: Magnesium transporter MRS2-5 [Sesamum radiatum]|uniref:Magnesium transporter n=1 Tax=Sesamum radiatum TaxID=300843 RepID=A0AAW2S2S1_SESRA